MLTENIQEALLTNQVVGHLLSQSYAVGKTMGTKNTRAAEMESLGHTRVDSYVSMCKWHTI